MDDPFSTRFNDHCLLCWAFLGDDVHCSRLAKLLEKRLIAFSDRYKGSIPLWGLHPIADPWWHCIGPDETLEETTLGARLWPTSKALLGPQQVSHEEFRRKQSGELGEELGEELEEEGKYAYA